MKVFENAPTISVVLVICIQKTMKTKTKTTCGVFCTKKTVPALPLLKSGGFSKFKKHNHRESFPIEKTKVAARTKNESETSTLASRDIENNIINPENVDLGTTTKLSSIKRKRRANECPPIPRKVEDFDNLLKNPDFETIDNNIFYRAFASANDELALIILAFIYISFLYRIYSIHVDSTLHRAAVDFYQLPIFPCLVLDTAIPVFYFLMSGKTCFLYHAAFLETRSLAPQFNPETFRFLVSDFEVALYSSIKFVFGSNLQRCLFHYRQNLYRKRQQLSFSCLKVREVASCVKQLMALPLFPTNKIHSVFFEFSSPVLGTKVLDSVATLFSFIEKEWIQPMDPKKLFAHGKIRTTNSEVESFHSSFGKRNGRRRPSFQCFLLELKCI